MSFLPLNTGNDLSTNYNTLNNALRQINHEQVTKTYNQPGGYAIIEGKLPYDGGYGTMYYDSNNNPVGIIGILPDGTSGIAWAKPGQSVLAAFGL